MYLPGQNMCDNCMESVGSCLLQPWMKIMQELLAAAMHGKLYGSDLIGRTVMVAILGMAIVSGQRW